MTSAQGGGQPRPQFGRDRYSALGVAREDWEARTRAAIRTVMYYAGVEGYTYAETAALMNIPIGTVMSRVSRGRHRLRVALAHLDHSGSAFAMTDQLSA